MKNLIILSVICILCATNAFCIENTLVIESDSTWLISTNQFEGWQNLDFDDSAWIQATSPNTVHGGGWATSYQIAEGIKVNSMWSEGDDYGVYFRKSFIIESCSIESAILYSNSDDDHKVYVNNILVATDMDGLGGPILTTDIKDYLKHGKNVIAVYGQDTYGYSKDFHIYSIINFSNV